MTDNLFLSVLDYIRHPFCTPFFVDVLVAFVIDRSESNMNAIFFVWIKVFHIHHRSRKDASGKWIITYQIKQFNPVKMIVKKLSYLPVFVMTISLPISTNLLHRLAL